MAQSPSFRTTSDQGRGDLKGRLCIARYPHLLLWAPRPFWIVPGGPAGLEELLPYINQPQSPTSTLSKAAPHLSLFHCKKANSSLCPCPHPQSTEDEVSMIRTPTSIPSHDLCPVPYHFLVHLLPGPLPQPSKCLPAPGSSLPVVLLQGTCQIN